MFLPACIFIAQYYNGMPISPEHNGFRQSPHNVPFIRAQSGLLRRSSHKSRIPELSPQRDKNPRTEASPGGTLIIPDNSDDVLTNSTPTPLTYFGLHIHHLVTADRGHQLTLWPPIKFGSWRLWDAGVAWPNLEPAPHEWNFNVLDAYVRLARLHHTQIVLPLELTPPWASAHPYQPSAYGYGLAAPPRALDEWRRYVFRVATRYKGVIRYYELWNEINSKQFYTGSVRAMVVMARVAYQALKTVDPNNQLISPSMYGSGQNLALLSRYLSAGGRRYADIIGYHFYVPSSAPEAMLPLIRRVKKIMMRNGLGTKPLWDTETGWRIVNTDSTPDPMEGLRSWRLLGARRAANFVSRALILGRAASLGRFFWYAWDNQGMGLINLDTMTLKPAANAYAQTESWIIGRPVSCRIQDPVIACELGNEGAQIVWSTRGQRSWKPPRGWEIARAQELNGKVSSRLNSTHILIDGAPQFLTLRQSPESLSSTMRVDSK